MKTSRVTIHTLREMKRHGERIAMLTCYDASFARLLDESHVDVLLVGDSLGMVIQGHDTTLPVTLDEMIYHCRAVSRGAGRQW
jgi:3-methyl-2-oxobutanoate hydroxymethyltransferase